MHNSMVFSIFLIFTGAAIASTVALFTRQSLLVGYMLLGMLLGPTGLKFVSDSAVIRQIGDIGIIFLLFLLGLNLHPQKLFHMLRKATVVAVITSFIFALSGFLIAKAFGYTYVESLLIGASLMFSSTIIGLKLLPTTILHHRHTGEVMISVLLLQDLLAILVLLFITGAGEEAGLTITSAVLMILGLPVLFLIAFLAERYFLIRLLAKFDHVKEYIFLLSIGWCLGMAELADVMGLSAEIGAFIAGVTVAASPIALYIAESLKPLRDFFLVMFFFTIGASFDLHFLPVVIIPAILLAGVAIILKPLLFSYLLQHIGETKAIAWEVGVRLGQASEFSLLVAYLALAAPYPLMSKDASYLIQAMTILSFFVSSYWVVLRYPTPMALTERMRRD